LEITSAAAIGYMLQLENSITHTVLETNVKGLEGVDLT
jgi:hypothetical protein